MKIRPVGRRTIHEAAPFAPHRHGAYFARPRVYRSAPPQSSSQWQKLMATRFETHIARRLDPERCLHLQSEETSDSLFLFTFLPARAGELLNASGCFPRFVHPFSPELFDRVLMPARGKNIF